MRASFLQKKDWLATKLAVANRIDSVQLNPTFYIKFNHNIDDWTIYEERLEEYFKVNIFQDNHKVTTLISLIGISTYKLLRDLCYPYFPEYKTFQNLCDTLSQQFSPHASLWRERTKFYGARQEMSESVIVTILKTQKSL